MTARRDCTLEDLLGLESLSDPQSAPDGDHVAVVVTRRDPDDDQDRDRTHIDAVDVSTGERRQLTRGPGDRSPRWSPDGRWLAFLRGEDSPAQLWLLPTGGGEARSLTGFVLGVGEIAWSPDSSRLAVTAPELPEGAQPHDPVVVTRLVSKADGTGRLGPMTAHAHVVDVETGEATQLTSGEFVVRDLSWAPDGAQLALVTAQHETRDLDAVSHLFVLPAGGGELRQVTQWQGTASAPCWTPDGSALVFAGKAEPLSSGHTRLWQVPAEGGVPQQVAPDLDRNVMVGGPGYPGARPRVDDNGEVLFCLRDRGAVHLAAVPLASGEV
ncbi:MAG: serine hydrolase, partial [Actinobacteria bacterium]|nr:serine hydrolase [Actinomycetota bacterium]